MYWEMFYEENYEDDLAIINSRNQGNNEMSDRQDSSSSAEMFLPNADGGVIPRSSSHGTLRYEQDPRRLKMTSSLEERQHYHYHQSKDMVQRSDSEPTRGAHFSLPKHSISDYHLGGEQSYSDSPPSLSKSSHQPDVYYAKQQQSMGTKSRSSSGRLDPSSSGEGGQLVRPAYRGSMTHRPNSITDSLPPPESEQRSKLNQRRTRNEKRYYTADSIQELRKDSRGDASIHKRLSWNLGTGQQAVDINIDDRHSYLKNKTFSSDSIKSMPSSSGVSSTGSLHLSPESEIFEEYEDDDDDEDIDSALLNNNSAILDNKHFINSTRNNKHELSLGFDGDSITSNQSDSVTSESSSAILPAFGDHHSHEEVSDSNSSVDASSSANTISDTSSISVKDVKEGVGSAEVKGSKKMGQKELRYMKKHLLLNSTLEAS